MLNSIRLRLTAWYVLVFGLLLGGFSVVLYLLLARDLYGHFDRELTSDAKVTATFFHNEVLENHGDIPAGAIETLEELQIPGTALAIFERDRRLAATESRLEELVRSEGLLAKARNAGDTAFATAAGVGREGSRIAVVPVRSETAECFVVAMAPLDPVAAQLRAVRRILGLAFPATLLLAGWSGFLLAKKSLAPMVAMSSQAAQIGSRNLHERLPVGNSGDEVGRLAEVFNGMLGRLERAFESMRSFMADASHELRTPLAVIRGEADVSLTRERPAEEYRASLGIIHDESKRMSRLVEEMFDLARADAGHRPLNLEEFYLNDVVEECCRSAQALSHPKNLALTVEAAADVPFRGDAALIRQMTLNLLDNAIRYTPAGGSVAVRLERQNGTARITVTDTGIGIPAEAQGKVFERFYRVDKARSRAAGGSGLGLAIVKWVAEAHRGSVSVASDAGRGSTFTVQLPLEA